jgi:hypothetical protein
MDKKIRVPKKARQMNAYNYELSNNRNHVETSLPIESSNDRLNNLDKGNELERKKISYELCCENTMQDEPLNDDRISISKPLLIENCAELLIQKLLKDKLRHLNSNDAKLSYYYQGSI